MILFLSKRMNLSNIVLIHCDVQFRYIAVTINSFLFPDFQKKDSRETAFASVSVPQTRCDYITVISITALF